MGVLIRTGGHLDHRAKIGVRLMKLARMTPQRLLAPSRATVDCPIRVRGLDGFSIRLPADLTIDEARRMIRLIALWAFDDEAHDAVRALAAKGT